MSTPLLTSIQNGIPCRRNILVFFLITLFSLMVFSPAWADRSQGDRGLFSAINAPGLQKANEASFRHRTMDIDVDMLKEKNLVLNLFDDTEFDVERVHVTEGAEGEFTWSGSITGPVKGTVNITVFGDAIAGSVNTDGQLFEINPAPGGRVTIEEIDLDQLPPHQNPHFPDAEPAGADSSSESTTTSEPVIAADSGDIIDLLVVYTQATLARYGQSGIETKIINAVNALNDANNRSAINAQFRLVHMAEVTYTETGDMTDALYGITNKNDGIMENVHTLRDSYGADIVSLIDEDNNYCGIAWVMQNVSSGFSTNAFNVTYSSCLSSHTLSHEIGHNEGCMHDRANSSFGGSYAYSYGHRDTTEGFRTIMSYSCSGGACPRISNFSNPDVLYNGVPTGIDHDVDPNNSADNARSKNNTASTVANWRQAVNQTAPAAPTGLLAFALSGDEIQVTWSDNADNEDGYYIERSLDGNAWQQIATTGPGASSYNDNGLEPDTMYYYQARAYNGVGTSVYSNSDSAMTTSNSLPTSGFTYTVSGQTIDFTDTSSDSDGSISGWVWDFGDSNGSSSQNPQHTYATGGDYTVTLTVADNDGATDMATMLITVEDPPPFVDQYSTGSSTQEGTVSGSYTNTHADDGSVQSITEQESSGNPSKRRSSLQHNWTFSVSSGNSIILTANAWISGPADADSYIFAYSTDGSSYTNLFTVLSTDSNNVQMAALPAGLNGTVYIRVVDSDNSQGERVLGQLSVDHLVIRTDNEPVTPPTAPSGLSAIAMAHNQVDLSWTDNASDETAYEIERADGGASNWSPIATVSSNTTTYSDNSVSAESTYDYRVRAMKGATPSGYSNTGNATTPAGPAVTITLTANGYKVKGVQTVELSWSGATSASVDIMRDGTTIATVDSGDGPYTDTIGAKGGGSYLYEVCEAGTLICSDPVPVTF